MNEQATRIPSGLDDLPEPARAKANHFYQELIEQGEEEGEAISQARGLVSKWLKERMPGS